MNSPAYERADLSKLVRPEDFRRALNKMLTEPRDTFERHAKFTEVYSDALVEAGYKRNSTDYEVARTVLAAFNFGLFEHIY